MRRMRPGRAAMLAAIVLLAVACGGDEPGAGAPTGSPDGRTGRTVEVTDNTFVPAERTVTVGTEIIWTQTGTNPHTVTASDGSFDSHANCPNDPNACMKDGDTFRHTFAQAGRFTYACRVHGEPMSGTIVVE